jgi:hypothetical protein
MLTPMDKLKTMRDILEERMRQRAAMKGDAGAIIAEGQKQLTAAGKRLEADPALRDFATMWARATLHIINTNPVQLQAFVLQEVITYLVMDWDSIKEEFDSQFQENK